MSKLRMRETTRDERRSADEAGTPMLIGRVPGSADENSTYYFVLEQWDENRGNWEAVPVKWQ